MDVREFVQGYVDSWMEGRRSMSHDELRDAYRRAKQLHDELFGSDADKPVFGFCAVLDNDLDDGDEE